MMYNPSAKLSHEESSSGLSHRDSAGELGLEETSSRYEDDDERPERVRRRIDHQTRVGQLTIASPTLCL